MLSYQQRKKFLIDVLVLCVRGTSSINYMGMVSIEDVYWKWKSIVLFTIFMLQPMVHTLDRKRLQNFFKRASISAPFLTMQGSSLWHVINANEWRTFQRGISCLKVGFLSWTFWLMGNWPHGLFPLLHNSVCILTIVGCLQEGGNHCYVYQWF